MKTVILCGGKGTRAYPQTLEIPKPLMEVAGQPVLGRLMAIYAAQGFTDFVLAAGYKQEMIQAFAATLDPEWKVDVVDTGESTNTGGRVVRVADLVEEQFFLTYADGLGNVDLRALRDFHNGHPGAATADGRSLIDPWVSTDTGAPVSRVACTRSARSAGELILSRSISCGSVESGMTGGHPPDGPHRTLMLRPPSCMCIPLGFDTKEAAGAGMGSGGYVVYDTSHCIVKVLATLSHFLMIESCGQCPPCKEGTRDIYDKLDALEAGRPEGKAAVDGILRRLQTVQDGRKCELPTGARHIVESFVRLFPHEFEDHAGRHCPIERDIRFPKLVDLDEEAGRFVYDETYHLKRPDWSYATASP
jgi:hypothetical protein